MTALTLSLCGLAKQIGTALGLTVTIALVAAAQTPPLSVVAVLPRDTLSAVQFAAMTGEVQRIWLSQGIRLRWQAGVPPTSPRSEWTVMIHVVPNIKTEERPEPLGAAVGAQGPLAPAVFVSRQVAGDLMASAGVPVADGRFDLLYGRLLGRVVAHELGHLLLQTREHREAGLMRRRFEKLDVLSTATPRFKILDRDRTLVAQFRADVHGVGAALQPPPRLLAAPASTWPR